MKALGYFVCTENVIWTVYEDGESNYSKDISVDRETMRVFILGEYEGEESSTTPRLVDAEYVLWRSLMDLSAHIVADTQDCSIDDIRTDLAFQLTLPDELDWSYFLLTAARALKQADLNNRNMRDI